MEFLSPAKPLLGSLLIETHPKGTFAYPIRQQSPISVPQALSTAARQSVSPASLPLTLPIQTHGKEPYVTLANQVIKLPVELPSQGRNWLQLQSNNQWLLIQAAQPVKLQPLPNQAQPPSVLPNHLTPPLPPSQSRNTQPSATSPVSMQSSASPSTMAPPLATAQLATAQIVPQGLKLVLPQTSILLPAPIVPISGSVLMQKHNDHVQIAPILKQQSFIPSNALLSPIHQSLAQTALPLVLPLQITTDGTQLRWQDQIIKLPVNLANTGQYYLQLNKPQQWQILQLGNTTVLPLTTSASAQSTEGDPISARPLLFERAEPSLQSMLFRQLSQPLGQSSLSQLPLPSLAQLASPALFAELFNQIGQFPYGQNLSAPLGSLAALWHRLLLPSMPSAFLPLPPFDEPAETPQLKQDLLSKLTPLIDELARFQQHSKADPEQPQLFITLPYGQEKTQRQLQMALHGYRQQANKPESAFWILSLRFELDTGQLLLKARYQQDQHLNIQALASSPALHKAVTRRFDALRERFSLHGVAVDQLHCRLGDVPSSLISGQTTEPLVYGTRSDNR